MRFLEWFAGKVAMFVVCASIVAGCANPCVTRENYKRIQEGMPMEQVEQVLGSPSRKHKDKCYYKGKYGTIEIEVEHGCVDEVHWKD